MEGDGEQSSINPELQRDQDRWRWSRATRKVLRQRAWVVATSCSSSSLCRQATYEFCYETLRRMVDDGSLSFNGIESWDLSPTQKIVRPAPPIEQLDGSRELQQLLQHDQGRWRRSQATRKRLRRRAWDLASSLSVNSPLQRQYAYAFCYEALRRIVADGSLPFDGVESWKPSPADILTLETLGIRG